MSALRLSVSLNKASLKQYLYQLTKIINKPHLTFVCSYDIIFDVKIKGHDEASSAYRPLTESRRRCEDGSGVRMKNTSEPAEESCGIVPR